MAIIIYMHVCDVLVLSRPVCLSCTVCTFLRVLGFYGMGIIDEVASVKS